MNVEDLKQNILLTNAEVATIFRTNAATLRKRIQLGGYKGLYRKEGKYVLWSANKLIVYLELNLNNEN